MSTSSFRKKAPRRPPPAVVQQSLQRRGPEGSANSRICGVGHRPAKNINKADLDIDPWKAGTRAKRHGFGYQPRRFKKGLLGSGLRLHGEEALCQRHCFLAALGADDSDVTGHLRREV